MTKQQRFLAKQPDIKKYNRNKHLKHKFGMTIVEWDALFEAQGRTCAICGADEPGVTNWHTDHCHETGKVRGILCRKCNLLLGWANDSVDKLTRAHAYLTQ